MLHLVAIWTSLANSPHEHGSWRVEHAGVTYRGDWKVTSIDPSYNAGAHQAIQQRWVHFASSTSSDYCTIALEDPNTMYCRNTKSCPQPYNCRSAQLSASKMRATLHTAEPTLAIERTLFARIHQHSVEAQLGARWESRGDRMRLIVAHRKESSKQHHVTEHAFDRGITALETTFSVGPRSRDVHFTTTREVEQFTERCTYPAHAATSCMMVQPTCVRR